MNPLREIGTGTVGILIYLICDNKGDTKPPAPVGVGGRSVRMVESGALGAVVSPAPARAEGVPPIHDVLAHERVVEEFHRNRTVLPVRYGSVLEDDDQVRGLLWKQRQEYRSALTKLRGCVEMGIRIIPPDRSERAAPHPYRLRPQPSGHDEEEASGRAYLLRRGRYYARRDQHIQEEARMVDRISGAFTELCAETKFQNLPLKAQGANNGPVDAALSRQLQIAGLPFDNRPLRGAYARMISIYFLVHKERLGPFREAFRALCERGAANILLTGPWPPYNFTPGI